MKVNIKGTNYKVNFVDVVSPDNETVVGGSTHYINKTIKLAKVLNFDDMCENISHELFHAFMYVCGMDIYCYDENLVHFLGRQYLDILKCFLEVLSYCYPNYKNVIKRLKKLLV